MTCLEFVWHIHIVTSSVFTQVGNFFQKLWTNVTMVCFGVSLLYDIYTMLMLCSL